MSEVGYDGTPVVLIKGYLPDVGVTTMGKVFRLHAVRQNPAVGTYGPTLDG